MSNTPGLITLQLLCCWGKKARSCTLGLQMLSVDIDEFSIFWDYTVEEENFAPTVGTLDVQI